MPVTDAQIRTLQKRIDRLESRLDNIPQIRRGVFQVRQGTNFVPFDKAFDSTNYSFGRLEVRVTNSQEAKVTVNNKARQGFTCYCARAGTLDYSAYSE